MKFLQLRQFHFLISQRFILLFMWSTLVIAGFFAVRSMKWEVLFVIMLTFLFTAVPTILHRWYDIHLPKVISLFGVFFAYFSLFLGEIHNFYEKFWWWDTLLHGVSAVVFGLVGLGAMRMMRSAQTIDAGAGVMSVFGFTFALAIGALWEIIEFVLDEIFGLQMQVSLHDTMTDLIVDGIGALVVITFGYLHWKNTHRNFIGKAVERFAEHYRKQR